MELDAGKTGPQIEVEPSFGLNAEKRLVCPCKGAIENSKKNTLFVAKNQRRAKSSTQEL